MNARDVCCNAQGWRRAARGAFLPVLFALASLAACGTPSSPTAPASAPDLAASPSPAPRPSSLPAPLPTPPAPPAPELPLAQDPSPTVWRPELVPEAVRDDARARALLAEVAVDGLVAHVATDLGVVWSDAGAAPTAAAGPALAAVGAELGAALAAGVDAVPCRAGVCAVADEASRWLVMVRRSKGGGPRVVAGLLRSAGWPAAPHYAAWATATRASWQTPTMALLGEGLSFEEAGRHEDAVASFERLAALDPENPWALYYAARALAALQRPREAYVAFRRLTEHPAAPAVVAQLRLGRDPEMARFRAHSAVVAVHAEAELPAPEELGAFAAWLGRFRASTDRLAEVVAAEGPPVAAVAELLEARLLDPPRLERDPPAITWDGARLLLKRNALGGLEVVGLEENTAPAPR